MRQTPVILHLFLGACVAYNAPCKPPAGESVGELQRALDLRAYTLQTQEAAAGNLVADAMLAQTPGADLAVVPASAFSRAYACGERDFVERGRVTDADIAAMLPGDTSVALFSVTADELRAVLETSVGALPGEHPAFLHVANMLLSVDCAASPRVTSLFADGISVQPAQTFKLATLMDTPAGTLLVDTHRPVRDLVGDYLRERSPVLVEIEGRISLRESCVR